MSESYWNSKFIDEPKLVVLKDIEEWSRKNQKLLREAVSDWCTKTATGKLPYEDNIPLAATILAWLEMKKYPLIEMERKHLESL